MPSSFSEPAARLENRVVLLIRVGRAGGCLRKHLHASTSGSKGKQETGSDDFNVFYCCLPPQWAHVSLLAGNQAQQQELG